MPAAADLPVAIDTSVAVPLLLRNHRAHDTVARWWAGRPMALSGHAAIETFAVLTRLPGDSRVGAEDAAALIAGRFEPVVLLSPETTLSLPLTLAGLGIVGGAVYDGIVALAALENERTLATRDARAKATYARVGVRLEIVV